MEITGILQGTSCPALHQRLVLIVLGLSCVIWPVSGPTVENDTFCSRIESSTVTYQETYQASRTRRTTKKCGTFNWSRCTAFRTYYVTETRVANRETYNVVYFCCNGGAIMPNGACQSNATDPTTTNQSDQSTTPVFVTKTTPTSAKNPPDIGPPFWGSDELPTSSIDPPASAPGEIAKPKDPGPPGRGDNVPQDSASGEGHYGMIGGVVGVVAALVVMTALMVLFMSRRKRRQRDKRAESHPGVVFQMLSANSPERGPSPDIYTEIPDREANASPISGGSSCKDVTDAYSVAFMNSQQSSANGNTYQDVTEPGSRFKGASGMLPTTTNVDAEVRLTENGAMFAKPRNENMVAKVGSPYRNLPELHEDAPEPDIYDMVGANGSITTVAANPKPDIPVDPEDKAYNMIIIGQNEDGNKYDKLARKRGGSKVSLDDQLDLPIPAATGYSAPGYSALGADTHRGYDKLSRLETHAVDPERKPGTLGSNTYDELAAQHRKNDYDKLARRGSDDHGLTRSGTSSGNAKGLPNGGPPENEYDSVIIGAPADGEIYGNLPKKPIQTRLAIKIPPSDSKLHHPISPPVKSPVARPVYDVIPGSTRTLPSPIYDILPKSPDVLSKSPDVLPKSPDHVGVAPVYDIPPAAKTRPSVSSVDEGATDVGGARPVYDTPPVKTDNACPLQFTETSPVYENTPTRRN